MYKIIAIILLGFFVFVNDSWSATCSGGSQNTGPYTACSTFIGHLTYDQYLSKLAAGDVYVMSYTTFTCGDFVGVWATSPMGNLSRYYVISDGGAYCTTDPTDPTDPSNTFTCDAYKNRFDPPATDCVFTQDDLLSCITADGELVWSYSVIYDSQGRSSEFYNGDTTSGRVCQHVVNMNQPQNVDFEQGNGIPDLPDISDECKGYKEDDGITIVYDKCTNGAVDPDKNEENFSKCFSKNNDGVYVPSGADGCESWGTSSGGSGGSGGNGGSGGSGGNGNNPNGDGNGKDYTGKLNDILHRLEQINKDIVGNYGTAQGAVDAGKEALKPTVDNGLSDGNGEFTLDRAENEAKSQLDGIKNNSIFDDLKNAVGLNLSSISCQYNMVFYGHGYYVDLCPYENTFFILGRLIFSIVSIACILRLLRG